MRGGLITRLVVVTVALAVIVASAFVFLLVAMSGVDHARAVAVNSAEEAYAARDVRRALGDMETSERGYLITGQESFLAPWQSARQRIAERLTKLRSIVDDPEQAARAEQLERDGLSYLNDYSVPLVDAARRGEPWVRSLPTSVEGKQRMDELRRLLDDFLSTEYTFSSERQAKADNLYRRATIVAGVGLVLSIVVTGVSAVFLARGVVSPVRRTARMAERLAAGDLEARVPQTGNGEIGVLEKNFNSMAESLQQNRDELARLNDQQNALRHVATLVAEGRPSDEVFAAVATEVGLLTGSDITRLLRFESDGDATVCGTWAQLRDPVPMGARIAIGTTVAAHVRATGTPARRTEVSPPDLPDGTYCAVGAPIIVGGAQWGAITALSPIDRVLPDDTETRMAEFTDLVGTAIANAQARTDLMASRARIVAAADESRRRIERDLHDGIQQRLVTLALKLRTVDVDLPPEATELRESLAAVRAGLVEAVEELREVTRGIHPAILSDGGLGPALRTLSRRSSVPVESDLHVGDRLPSTVEAAAYYVAAEAMTNVAKHAGASFIDLRAMVAEDVLLMTIRDDGTGGADPSRGSGLIGLIDRVEALGGTLAVDSPEGAGTTLRVVLPLDDRQVR
ncbi:CHASE3 domain-containing protein [Mycobacterium neglectum]|uniref:CHASE3 domain-containing protein n=1 Tax=Mycobacterium neglectum TaxID=242737 RepID=UPI000BFF0C2F|nr:CHASE3 domain-containing protein [Mycobacterium neglectum]